MCIRDSVRTASRRDGPDAVRDGSKSTKRPPTTSSPPDAVDATPKKINRRRNTRRAAQAPLDAPPQHAADVQGLRKGTGFSSLQQHVGEPADRSFRSRTRTFTFSGTGTSRRPNALEIAPETTQFIRRWRRVALTPRNRRDAGVVRGDAHGLRPLRAGLRGHGRRVHGALRAGHGPDDVY